MQVVSKCFDVREHVFGSMYVPSSTLISPGSASICSGSDSARILPKANPSTTQYSAICKVQQPVKALILLVCYSGLCV